MKILLTGGTGFLGSHLAEKWVALGYDIILLVRTKSNFQRIERIMDQVSLYNMDLVAIEKPFMDHPNIDVVFHTATNYGRKDGGWYGVFETNLEYSISLLNTAIAFNIDVFFNTDTVLYETINYYSLSKKQFTEWGKMLAGNNLVRFINLKLQHIYGPGDDITKFTTYIIESCMRNDQKLLLTPGNQKRDFIYVDDVVDAFQVLLGIYKLLPKSYHTYEIGTGVPVSIHDFVNIVKYLSGSTIELQFGALPYRENEQMLIVADNSKLRELGWTPKVLINDGIIKILKGR